MEEKGHYRDKTGLKRKLNDGVHRQCVHIISDAGRAPQRAKPAVRCLLWNGGPTDPQSLY